MKVPDVATVCHEVNKAYCEAIGDFSQPSWGDAPDWQRLSAINGVKAHLAGTLDPRQSHESWLKEKIANGWRFGPVKNPELKQHPCCVSYDELPREQKAKDHIFGAIVEQLKPFVEEEEVP